MLTGRGQSRRDEAGGSAPDGAAPSNTPLSPRTVPPLPAYTPNTWDKSGRRRVEREIHTPYIREGTALWSTATQKEALHLALKLLHRGIERFPPWIEDDRPLGIQPVQLQAHRLADAAPDSVTHDGFANRPRHSKADARSLGLRLAKAEGREQGTADADALIVDFAEFSRT